MLWLLSNLFEMVELPVTEWVNNERLTNQTSVIGYCLAEASRVMRATMTGRPSGFPFQLVVCSGVVV